MDAHGRRSPTLVSTKELKPLLWTRVKATSVLRFLTSQGQ